MTTLPDGHAWAIRNWDEAFTRRDSKQCKTLHWVPWPVKLQGKGYRILASTREGLIALGVFAGLVEAAANLPTRGVLADESGPLDAMDMGVRTGIPYPIVADAIPILAGPKVGWLVPTGWTDGGPSAKVQNTVSGSQNAVSLAVPPSHSPQAEQKRREEKRSPQLAQDARASGAEIVIDLSDLPACLPGADADAARALAELGVDNPARDRLVESGVTPEAIVEEFHAAQRGDPRRWRSVMVAALLDRYGLRKVRRTAGTVGRAVDAAAARIERLRKERISD